VLQLLDNVAYYAMTMEDTVVPCRNDDQGRHHVDGNIMLTLPEFLQPFSWNCLLLYQSSMPLLKNLQLILVFMPRYMTAPCCADLEHLHKKSRYQLQENNSRML
jgi:hypothetical protein